MSFSGKRVLVTGGGRGLGLQIAKCFHEAGAIVVILDREQSLLDEVSVKYPTWKLIKADLLDWEGTRDALSKVETCHHVVNNAGINVRQDLLDVTPDNIDKILGINFKAIVNVTQVMVKKMIEDKIAGGTIVNISSYAAKMALPSISMYSASKAAVVMLTKNMSLEFGPHNIRANCICPTYMITDFTKDYIEKNPERFQEILDKQVFKKFLDPVEAAKAALWLSGPETTMITGTSLDIEGGALV